MAAILSTELAPRTIYRTLMGSPFSIIGTRSEGHGTGGVTNCGARKGMTRGTDLSL